MRRRRVVGPCCQPRARPVHRAARACSGQTDWWWTGVVSAGSMWCLLGAPLLLVPPCSPRPGSPRDSYLLLGFAHALFRTVAFDRTPLWGYTTLLPLNPSPALPWVIGINKSCSLASGHPHPPLLGAGSPRVVFHVQDVGLYKFSNFPGSFPFLAF